MKVNSKFNKRAFFSIGMLATGLMLPVSGLINHNLGFEPLSVSRHFWMSVHNISGIMFTVFAVYHAVYNRQAIMHYAVKVRGLLVTKEALTAISLVIIITSFFALHAFIAG